MHQVITSGSNYTFYTIYLTNPPTDRTHTEIYQSPFCFVVVITDINVMVLLI